MIFTSEVLSYWPLLLLALLCTADALHDDVAQGAWLKYALALALLGQLLSSCEWFESARVCNEGAMSCDGDFVRVCVVDEGKESTNQGTATKWVRQQACDDDPVLGARTCGLVGVVAMCVAQSEDGAVLGPDEQGTSASDWLRVDVADEGEGLRIAGTSAATLEGVPASATAGVVAAVAYAGSKPVDAALVPIAGTSGRSSVWLRATSATRVALVDPDEQIVDQMSVAAGHDLGIASDGLAAKQHALLSDLPPTLRVLEPEDVAGLPPALLDAQCVPAPSSAARLEFVGRALNRLELVAASAFTELAFVTQEDRADQDAGAGDAGTMDAGIAAGDGGSGRSEPPRTLLDGTRLYVDVSPAREEDYMDGPEIGELDLDLIRSVALSYSRIASLAAAPNGPQHGRYQTPAAEYPAWIVDLVKARPSPMVPIGGTFVSSWRALHESGVQVGIARAYADADAGVGLVLTDEQAVRDGFASAAGSAGSETDFAEYLARTVIFERWVDGPCNELHDARLEQLAARLMVPLAKLDVLWGLGLISHAQRATCIGTAAAAPNSAGFRLHKATSETITIAEEPQGIKLVLSQGETHVSGTASRGKQSAVFDLMYRRGLPGVIRMQRGAGVVLGDKGDQHGATFSLTDQEAVDFAPSLGGLLVMQEVTRDRISGHALMVTLGRPMFGATVLPLVTFRFDQPFWSDTPVDVDDLDLEGP
jgi:hypothetical protein